jgi:hypothetical protein
LVVVILLFDAFVVGSVGFKVVTVGLHGTGDWIVEISGPQGYRGFVGAVVFQALVTFALWRLQLKLASRVVTAHVVNRTLDEVAQILAKAPTCDREGLLRKLTNMLTQNLIDGEPRLMEFTLRRSDIVKSGNTGMAWETAITTVRVFAKGPVPAEFTQSLRELVSNLRG